MKKICALMMLCCITLSTQAEVLLSETFNLADGTSIETNSDRTTVLTCGAWNVSRKSGDHLGTAPKVATRPAMNYPGYVLSGQTKVAVLDATIGTTSSDQRISAYYVDTLAIGKPYYTRYFAFLINPTSAPNTSGRDFFVIEGSITSSSTRGRLFLASISGNQEQLKVGVTKNSSSATDFVWSPTLIDKGETNLIIVKYESIEGTENDKIKVFINPDLTKNETSNTCITTTDNTQSDIRPFAAGLRQRGIGADIAGVRIADTWNEVVGIADDNLNIESTTPTNDAFVTSSLTAATLTFNKTITTGTGKIILSSQGNDSINIPLSSCIINDKTVTIPISLTLCRDYTLTISTGAFMSGSVASNIMNIDFTTREDNANLMLQEYFSYKTDNPLESINRWIAALTSKVGISPVVAATPLSYSGYAASGKGGALVMDADAQGSTTDAHVSTTPFTATELAIDATTYTAFMVNLSNGSATTSGRDIFSYLYNSGNGTSRGRVFYKLESNNLAFGITKSASAPSEWSVESEKDNTALLIVKYINRSKTSAGAADEFYLYVNPDLTKDEAQNASIMLTPDDNSVSGGANIQNIAFKCYNTNAIISGVRVAKTWADAAPYNSAMSTLQPTFGSIGKSFVKAIGKQLHYTGTEAAVISIYNAVGQLIQSINATPNAVVTMTHTEGIYIVRTQTTNGQIGAEKVVLK